VLVGWFGPANFKGVWRNGRRQDWRGQKDEGGAAGGELANFKDGLKKKGPPLTEGPSFFFCHCFEGEVYAPPHLTSRSGSIGAGDGLGDEPRNRRIQDVPQDLCVGSHVVELRTIEEIVALKAQLQTELLAQLHFLGDGQVGVNVVGAVEMVLSKSAWAAKGGYL